MPGSLVGVVSVVEGWRYAVRAGEFAAPFPTVGLDTPVVEAARLPAGQNLPGLVVVDEAEAAS